MAHRKIKRFRAKGKRVDLALSNSAAQRGLDRKAHFAEGGDLVSYRGGTSGYQKDRRREGDRLSCRRYRYSGGE